MIVYLCIFLIFFLNSQKSQSAIEFFNNPIEKTANNSIFLIHVISPHPPFFFDKNCNINLKSDSLEIKNSTFVENYTYAYNCLIEIIKNWSNEKSNNMIFIFGDHGWSFGDEYMAKHKVNTQENRFKPFFSYKVPLIVGSMLRNLYRFPLLARNYL